MWGEPKMVQYIFLRGRVPSPQEVFQEDRGILSRVTPRNVKRGLEALLNAEDLGPYWNTINHEYMGVNRSGDISDRRALKRAVISAAEDAASFWGLGKGIPIEIVPAQEMLNVEREYQKRLNKEVGKAEVHGGISVLPSPDFVDHLEGRIMLSDRYIFLLPKSKVPSDIYFTGGADVQLYNWDGNVLRTMITGAIGNLATRSLRGETGENYLRMIRDMGSTIEAINMTIEAAMSYSLHQIMPDGGVPVLYRRFMDIFQNLDRQMFYIAMKALAEDMGIKNAILADGFYIQLLPGKRQVIGAQLWHTHPNFKHKNTIFEQAAKNLSYPVERALIIPGSGSIGAANPKLN